MQENLRGTTGRKVRTQSGFDFAAYCVDDHLLRSLDELAVLYHKFFENCAFRHVPFIPPRIRE